MNRFYRLFVLLMCCLFTYDVQGISNPFASAPKNKYSRELLFTEKALGELEVAAKKRAQGSRWNGRKIDGALNKVKQCYATLNKEVNRMPTLQGNLLTEYLTENMDQMKKVFAATEEAGNDYKNKNQQLITLARTTGIQCIHDLALQQGEQFSLAFEDALK